MDTARGSDHHGAGRGRHTSGSGLPEGGGRVPFAIRSHGDRTNLLHSQSQLVGPDIAARTEEIEFVAGLNLIRFSRILRKCINPHVCLRFRCCNYWRRKRISTKLWPISVTNISMWFTVNSGSWIATTICSLIWTIWRDTMITVSSTHYIVIHFIFINTAVQLSQPYPRESLNEYSWAVWQKVLRTEHQEMLVKCRIPNSSGSYCPKKTKHIQLLSNTGSGIILVYNVLPKNTRSCIYIVFNYLDVWTWTVTVSSPCTSWNTFTKSSNIEWSRSASKRYRSRTVCVKCWTW